jgi:hypothetical protein
MIAVVLLCRYTHVWYVIILCLIAVPSMYWCAEMILVGFDTLVGANKRYLLFRNALAFVSKHPFGKHIPPMIPASLIVHSLLRRYLIISE